MVTKEKDEELALFLELRRRDKEKSSFLVSNPLTSEAPLGNKGGISPATLLVPQRKTATERFLDSENEKSDYDWLITPPRTPLFPSVEMEAQKALMHQLGRTARPTALTSRLTNVQAEPASRTNGAFKPSASVNLSSGFNSSNPGNKRSSSTGRPRPASRPSTPTSRPTLASPKLGRSSTPTPRPTLSSTRPAPSAARSSTPTRTSTPRSSTPTSRPSLPSSKSSSRTSTPTRRSSAPSVSSSQFMSAPAGRSSSVTRSASVAYKTPVQSRGSSPTVKPRRPWNPEEMPGFSHEAPPNLKTSLAERPASATRGRPGARSSSPAAAPKGRPRQQSSSPAKRRTSLSGSAPIGRMPISIRSRSQIFDGDDLVSLRKLAPPKEDEHRSSSSNSSGKSSLSSSSSNSSGKSSLSSSSLDSTGYGRSLSKKSLDMALRHMDIRRSITSNLRPLMTNVPASSMYSVRSSGGLSNKSWTVSGSRSPHATSSNASSSEPSVSNALFTDGMGYSDENEFTSERGSSSPVSQASSRW